jgi:hypothetical protein
MIVDIHAHYFPKAYNEMLLRIGGRSLPEMARPLTARPMREDDPSDIPTRLERMHDAGVGLQELPRPASSTTPTPSWRRSTRAGSRPSSRCHCRTSTPRCGRWSAGSISSACSGCR